MKTSSRIVVSVLLIVFAGLFCILLSNLLDNIGHYCRVCENPLRVTAKVTKHRESEDSEGDTTYVSYITYTVDSKEYKDIKYESTSSKSRLTPIGETVAVDVSPEDPSSLMSSLEGSWIGVLGLSVAVSVLVTIAITTFLHFPLSDENLGIPSPETIQKDLKIKHFSNPYLFITMFLLIPLLVALIPHKQYAPGWFVACTIAAAILFLWRVITFFRVLGCIKREEYTIRRDTLVSKEIYSDSDSGNTYKLFYKSDDGEIWETNVTKKYYDKVCKDSTVMSVILSGKKTPFIHYDIDGNAQ